MKQESAITKKYIACATRRNIDKKPDYFWSKCYSNGAPIFYDTATQAYQAACDACANASYALYDPRSKQQS